VFNEYDYWAGTVSLVVFALAESILFAWIFGMDKGWDEIHSGADMRVPTIYRFIIKYITPVFLLFVFVGSVFSPVNGDWSGAVSSLLSGNGWVLDNGSLVKQVMNTGIKEQIMGATDLSQKSALETQLFYINAARILLITIFLGICSLVYIAYKQQKLDGRAT
jgi:hypothetical protein